MKARDAVVAMAVLLGLVGCSRHERPNWTYMPDMVYSPALKAQEAGAMRQPVAGTVARGVPVYHFQKDPEGAGRELKNPLEATPVVLERGKATFNTFCIVCHGERGHGDGPMVPKFPRPLSLHSERARAYPDGRIYHIIVTGQNLMPSYASQIAPEDRWAVIHYVRSLQASVTSEEIQAAETAAKAAAAATPSPSPSPSP